MGAYASVLFALGLVDNLQNLADAGLDIVGRELEEENLPKRVRPPKVTKAVNQEQSRNICFCPALRGHNSSRKTVVSPTRCTRKCIF